jgi:heme/copper-type cytochrome/quinol oxidase subunit 4
MGNKNDGEWFIVLMITASLLAYIFFLVVCWVDEVKHNDFQISEVD